LMLYCQLAEAGGVYETISNLLGVIKSKPYLLWPFQDLVRVKSTPKRIIGPNANATFRDLATTAKRVGFSGLSALLEDIFRDDIRNGVSHADYVLWHDGLRLRNRNGGNAAKLSFNEVSDALTRGVGFFQILEEYNRVSVLSFNPEKTIVGRLSANFPMPWTVSYDPKSGAFSMSGSSPGPVTTPEYERQENINSRLGGKVLAAYSIDTDYVSGPLDTHIQLAGFEPHNVLMNEAQFNDLIDDIGKLDLWDKRRPNGLPSDMLVASPWGFRWIATPTDFDQILEPLLVEFDFS
ncbi:MAG: hypothetical protein JNK47_25640, partial [Mesorhizobium sp.]